MGVGYAQRMTLLSKSFSLYCNKPVGRQGPAQAQGCGQRIARLEKRLESLLYSMTRSPTYNPPKALTI
jgi:hypothetical protein